MVVNIAYRYVDRSVIVHHEASGDTFKEAVANCDGTLGNGKWERIHIHCPGAKSRDIADALNRVVIVERFVK